MLDLFRALALLGALTLAACGSGSGNGNNGITEPVPDPLPEFDFTAVDERLQQFIDEDPDFDGISYILVDRDLGVIHRAEFGDHTPDLVTLLASGSKMPAASLLMALDSDESIDFDPREGIGSYLPFAGLYPDRTVEQLLSNTSGLPGLVAMLAAQDVFASHQCQFLPQGTLQACAESIYTSVVPGVVPAGTEYRYGGSQWQLAGAVAEVVSNSTWAQAWDAYIAEPCGLEVFEFGNMWSVLESWNGSPDSLQGRENPNIEGGAITNLADYASLLLMHLNDGACGDNQVMTAEAVAFMREDRGGEFGTPYGMGWFILEPEEGDGSQTPVYADPGLFGDTAWIDVERGIGGFVAIDRLVLPGSSVPVALVYSEIIDAVAAEVDRARADLVE